MPPRVDGLVLCVKLIDELIQVSHFGIGSKTHTFNHNLAIADNTLVQLGQIYQRELAGLDNEVVSQAILLAFMGRLAKHLKNANPGSVRAAGLRWNRKSYWKTRQFPRKTFSYSTR